MLLCLLSIIYIMFASDPAACLFLNIFRVIFCALSVLLQDCITHFERPRRLIFAFLYFNGTNSHLRKIVAKNALKRLMSLSGVKMSLSGYKVSIFCGQCRIFDISPKIGVCVPILRF